MNAACDEDAATDPVVEATMSRLMQSVDFGISREKMQKVKQIVTSIVENPSQFDVLAEKGNRLVKCNAAFDYLRQILMTEKKEPPQAPDSDNEAETQRKKTKSWTTNEDMRLIMGIHLYMENWNNVANFVGGGRTRSQCSQRWCRVIDPKISKDHWSPEEEQKLYDLVQIHGFKSWIKIAKELPGRTDVQCRYQYRKVCKSHEVKKFSFQSNSAPSSFFGAQQFANQQQVAGSTEKYFDNMAYFNPQQMQGNNNSINQQTSILPQFNTSKDVFETPITLDSCKFIFDPQSIFSSNVCLE